MSFNVFYLAVKNQVVAQMNFIYSQEIGHIVQLYVLFTFKNLDGCHLINYQMEIQTVLLHLCRYKAVAV